VYGDHGPIIEVGLIFPFSSRCTDLFTAYRASRYLDRLLSNGAILPQASPELDRLYVEEEQAKKAESFSGTTQTPGDGEKEDKQQQLLLTLDAVPRIVSMFDLPSSADADLRRAMEQAKMRVAGT
jgi:hypothetical protein